jgi:uncharacterized lipoprotein YehR (DUF1307 family)
MKKLTALITILVSAIFLAACSNGSESTRTFELEHDGIMTTMVYTSTGDKVTSQTTENVIPYDLTGLASKEEAQELFAPMIEQFQNIDGLTHKMEYDDSKAIETLAIDYEAVNFEEIENLPGMAFSEGSKDKGVSMEKSVEVLESQGFTEVK